MSDVKLISPLLDGFMIGDPISDHDGVRCCPAMRENSDDKYIVKIISVPASQKQLDALLFTGAYKDSAAAAEYFKQLSEETVKEARLLKQLSKLEGFLAYENWQIVPMDHEDLGFDVYLLGTYKRSLEKHLRRNPMTHLGAVNLGIDLCAALSLCRRAGFIYTDLKPSNIYITGQQEYRIGDLGFSKLNALKYTSLSTKHISRYTAPELHDPLETLNPTVDTYALGMILYQIYNNGVIPYEQKAPMRILNAPLNADYEMAEIILKACDPNPRKRYQTPIEMGQALVSYMQRNCVNDIPIVPPTVDTPSAAAPAAAPAQKAPEEIAPAAENEAQVSAAAANALPEELEFMQTLVSDETAPDEEDAGDLLDAKTTEEVEQILAQADSLIDHGLEVPSAPAEPEASEEEEENAEDEEDAEVEEEIAPVSASTEEEAAAVQLDDSQQEDDLDFALSLAEELAESDSSEDDLEFGLATDDALSAALNLSDFDDEDDDDGAVDFDFPDSGKPRKKGWIGIVIAVLILALLGGGAYYYFDQHYVLEIEHMGLSGFENQITVELSTDADYSLLTVICTDTYGNRKEQAPTDGVTVFTDLNPDMLYKISVEAVGFHKATGSIAGSFTTAEETDIVGFTAKAGAEDGSVILNFTVDGPEMQEWTVSYSADGEESQAETFSGHMVTINGLTVGKTYTFTLHAPDGSDLYLTGDTKVEYLASRIITAEDLTIVSCEDGVLKAQWTCSEENLPENWSVRCYNESGYDQTLTVTEMAVSFTDISIGSAYTLEVTAAGMSQVARAYVTANPATVTNIQIQYAPETGMTVSWESPNSPEGGWLCMYNVDGSETTEIAQCTGTTAVIKHVIPNASYSFQIKAADGSTVFGGIAEHPGIEAVPFEQYYLKAENIQSSLCRTPDQENWTHEDVPESSYTTSFGVGESASLVLYTSSTFYLKEADMDVTFVIRNANGDVIPSYTRTATKVWRDMWPGVGKYCYLTVPVMPTAEGNYTVELYFNGMAVLTKNFQIITTNG